MPTFIFFRISYFLYKMKKTPQNTIQYEIPNKNQKTLQWNICLFASEFLARIQSFVPEWLTADGKAPPV